MRNPLHYSSDILVKRAAPTLNIPQYQKAAPPINDAQIQEIMTNIQNYPEDQQQKILNTINQNYNAANSGGMYNNIMEAAGAPRKAWNDFQGSINDITDSFFGWKPFDSQDYNRDRSQQILQSAAKDPLLYRKVTQDLQSAGIMAKPQQSGNKATGMTPGKKTVINAAEFGANPSAARPAPAPTPTQPTPAPAQNAPINPNRKTSINAAEFADSATPAQQTTAPAQPVAPQQANNRAQAIASKFLAGGYAPNAPQPTLPAAQAQVAQPVAQAAPIPTPAQPAAPTPNTAPTTLVSAAKPATPSVQPTPQPAPQPTAQPAPQSATPWTDPNSKFDKNWSADQRAQYIRAKYK